jgi:hypothetical protein
MDFLLVEEFLLPIISSGDKVLVLRCSIGNSCQIFALLIVTPFMFPVKEFLSSPSFKMSLYQYPNKKLVFPIPTFVLQNTILG